MLNKLTPRQTLLSVLVLSFGLLAYVGIVALSRAGETKLTLTAIPSDARITINGSPTSAGSLYLRPGYYSFTASKQGWDTYKIDIKLGKEALDVGLIPDPASQEAKNYLTVHPSVQLQRESLSGKNLELLNDQVTNKTPLLGSLPYTDIYGPFKVDYGASDIQPSGGVLIQVSSSTPPGRQKFREWLKQQGQDPTDLEIQYYDFENPFAGGE